MNVLEGFRRIRFAVQGLALLIGVDAVAFYSPSQTLTFETRGPGQPWEWTQTECDHALDAVEHIYDVPNAIPRSVYQMVLCFRASEDFGQETALVPYIIEDRWELGDTPYSPEVSRYTRRRKLEFSLDPRVVSQIQTWADDQSRRTWRNNLQSVLIMTASFIIGLEIFGRVLGWICRGFIFVAPSPRRRTF